MNHKSGMHSMYLKFNKKFLERQFSLGMILEYCIKHTNHHTVPPIISMLNVFLRNSGNSTQEERDIIDQVEYKLLNNEVDDIRFFEDIINGDSSEQSAADKGKCFKFVNDFIQQKVDDVVKAYHHGSTANLALIEVTLFDHNLLKKRNAHTAFLKTLMAWEIIDQLSDEELKKTTNSMANKIFYLPSDGYQEWDGSDYVNDKKTCLDIGKELGPTIPYCRKKEG